MKDRDLPVQPLTQGQAERRESESEREEGRQRRDRAQGVSQGSYRQASSFVCFSAEREQQCYYGDVQRVKPPQHKHKVELRLMGLSF